MQGVGTASGWACRLSRYGRFNIRDSHPMGRSLTLSEVFTFSSNIGAARIALAQGVEAHKAFLRKLGQLDRLRTELPESAEKLLMACGSAEVRPRPMNCRRSVS